MLIGLAIVLAFGIYLSMMIVGKVADGAFMDWTDYFKTKWKLSEAVAGETIQALGTSAPEISVSIIGLYIFTENPALGLGTIIGSAIFQITPVIGIPLLCMKGTHKIEAFPVIRASIVYTISVLLLLLFISTGSQIEWWECSILALYHMGYASWIILSSDAYHTHAEAEEKETLNCFDRFLRTVAPGPEAVYSFIKGVPVGFILVLLVIGATCIGMVRATEVLGNEILGLSMAFLSLTVLAAGTSAPELASNVSLAKQGKVNQLIGNAVGSNTLDICISFALVSIPYTLMQGPIVVDGKNFEQMFTSTLILLALVVLFLTMMILSKWKTAKWQGIVLIAAYVIYVLYSLSIG